MGFVIVIDCLAGTGPSVGGLIQMSSLIALDGGVEEVLILLVDWGAMTGCHAHAHLLLNWNAKTVNQMLLH